MHCLQSPHSQTKSNFSSNGDQGIFSPEYGDSNTYNSHAPQDIEITIMYNVPAAVTIVPEN